MKFTKFQILVLNVVAAMAASALVVYIIDNI